MLPYKNNVSQILKHKSETQIFNDNLWPVIKANISFHFFYGPGLTASFTSNITKNITNRHIMIGERNYSLACKIVAIIKDLALTCSRFSRTILQSPSSLHYHHHTSPCTSGCSGQRSPLGMRARAYAGWEDWELRKRHRIVSQVLSRFLHDLFAVEIVVNYVCIWKKKLCLINLF